MTRLLAVLVLVLSPCALAAAAEQPAPAAPAKPAEPPAAAPAPAPEAGPEAVGNKVEREQMKKEVLDEVKKALDKQKEEVRDEVRAQVATQAANRALEEEFQFHEEKKKLELLELNGYYRVRPELFYQLDLGRGADPLGYTLFPTAYDTQCTAPGSTTPCRKTLADANMRWRLEPTLNISEDVRIHAQIDMLDNVIMGSTPSAGGANFGFLPTEYSQWSVQGNNQLPSTAGQNWLQNSMILRRAWGEVNTPVGQFVFGRMGSQWGMGMLTSAGNTVDSDYGDTVDRIMFVAKVADHYIVPMLDFGNTGPTSISLPNARPELQGQPVDLDQLDDVHDYSIAIARRDTDLELSRKLQAGQNVFNYGVYFTYRRQTIDAVSQTSGTFTPGGTLVNPTVTTVPRDANIYVPDIWAKFQTKKLRIELEAAGVFGSIGDAATQGGQSIAENGSVTLRQFGAVAQGEYKILDALAASVEVGFASGDKGAGMGNLPGRGQTVAGSIDGQQYCLAASCLTHDSDITNFRFNRDYRVDLILWREIFNGITDAFYLKPTARYEITEGLGVWASLIYSRAIYGESTPSSHIDPSTGQLTGDPNLGVEIDGGVRYDSGDGFVAGVAYGVLFPLAGMNNNADLNNVKSGSTAQTVRGWFVIKY